MTRRSNRQLVAAQRHFTYARLQADLERVLARLTGKSPDLLSFNEVRQQLLATGMSKQVLRDIPLDAIVGSVGRYTDFTRSFLPLRDSDRQRWARIEVEFDAQEGLPPIEVYQIGEAYFVIDGNHRVSVARQIGATHIEAFVTEVKTKVPLSPDTQPDDLILKARYARFLEQTRLDEHQPEIDLTMTAPGNYRILERQIELRRYMMQQTQQREIPYAEAAAAWFDQTYVPIVEVIRTRGMLRDFPKRTEADLYVWIAKHMAELKERWGWPVEPETAITDLVEDYSDNPRYRLARMGERLMESVIPGLLDDGPPPGQWRQEVHASTRNHQLFSRILVSINGREQGWHALDQALLVANRENAWLRGVHFVESMRAAGSASAQAIRETFRQRRQQQDIAGDFTFETGNIARTLSERARWADLVVINLNYAFEPPILNRLSANLEVLLRRCPRPILAISESPSTLDRAVLAYDGSAKAREALFVAAYLAGQWEIPLAVVAVEEEQRFAADPALQRAQSYLQTHRIEATYVSASGPAAKAILTATEEHNGNLIVMGGYGQSPMLEVVLGSTVDEVLRSSRWPVLICR
jgi:nucleotide-binding universal stress UspA family protein